MYSYIYEYKGYVVLVVLPRIAIIYPENVRQKPPRKKVINWDYGVRENPDIVSLSKQRLYFFLYVYGWIKLSYMNFRDLKGSLYIAAMTSCMALSTFLSLHIFLLVKKWYLYHTFF